MPAAAQCLEKDDLRGGDIRFVDGERRLRLHIASIRIEHLQRGRGAGPSLGPDEVARACRPVRCDTQGIQTTERGEIIFSRPIDFLQCGEDRGIEGGERRDFASLGLPDARARDANVREAPAQQRSEAPHHIGARGKATD